MAKKNSFWKMPELKDCVVIERLDIAAIFSGCDVWLIPVRKYVGKVYLRLKDAYVGDDWDIRNGEIIGYHSETCVIAVPKDLLEDRFRCQ
jgi:hypothetical protein